MFVAKLRTPSRANYEHFHVYLAYRRQTGTVVTRQAYDRAPRLTRPPTEHISRGDIGDRQEPGASCRGRRSYTLFERLQGVFMCTQP